MAISLEKRSESVRINLVKKNIVNLTANVGLLVDISGSMEGRFRSGMVQETIDRIFALAFNMDPDKTLDVWVFNMGTKQLSPMKEIHYGSYVKGVLARETPIGGGTAYAPPIMAAQEFYRPASKRVGGFLGFGGTVVTENAQPIYCIMITDGENADPIPARNAFKQVAGGNVYFQCIGIGNRAEFKFIEKMADEFDHVGFANLNDLDIDDEKLYDLLINAEFATWINNFKRTN